jgi:hypothetical protein
MLHWSRALSVPFQARLLTACPGTTRARAPMCQPSGACLCSSPTPSSTAGQVSAGNHSYVWSKCVGAELPDQGACCTEVHEGLDSAVLLMLSPNVSGTCRYDAQQVMDICGMHACLTCQCFLLHVLQAGPASMPLLTLTMWWRLWTGPSPGCQG